MKIASVSTLEGPTVAVLRDGQWIDFSKGYEACGGERIRTINELIESERIAPAFLSDAMGVLAAQNQLPPCVLGGDPKFLCPVTPGKIIALGRNYEAHAEETGYTAPEEPIFFSKSPSSCIAQDQPIVLRDKYGRVDHEGELAVVIARRCKEIVEAEAKDYIAGYTVLNDVTARDIQSRDVEKGLPWFRCKSIDTFCPMGPVLALPDEVGWPVEVDIEVRVNGEVRQQSNTKHFVFAIPRVLAFISSFMTLEPGDVVSTGTPEGIAPIKGGDVVEVEIPEIGVLKNPVVAERRRRSPVAK